MKKLGENIWRFREQAGLSQEQLAEALGVSRQTVSNWENDRATPDAYKFGRLCELLGVGAEELLGTSPSSPQKQRAKKRIAALVVAVLAFLFAVAAILLAVFTSDTQITSTVLFSQAFLWGAAAVLALAACLVALIYYFKKH